MTQTITIQIPIKFKKQGIRRLIMSPDAAFDQKLSESLRPDHHLINAIVKAWHWQRMIETRRCKNVTDLAEQEKVTTSYAGRILRLNSLAPDIRQAILDGRQPKTLRIIDIMPDFPELWSAQRVKFGFPPKDE